MRTLAERLVWARTQREFTQEDLAKRAGVAQSTIGSLEAGSRLTARKITAIAGALSVSCDWLAEGKGAIDASSSTTPPRVDASRRLQWLDDDEGELVSLYRACGLMERETALTVLRALPKLISDNGIDEAQST